jgi:hypothetical protein
MCDPDGWLIDWLFIVLCPAQEFHIYGDVTITSDRLQNWGLCSALRAFEQGGIFIVPHLLWHGASGDPDGVYLIEWGCKCLKVAQLVNIKSKIIWNWKNKYMYMYI